MGDGFRHRPLTEPQFRRLMILGSAACVVAPRKRDWEPLLRRGFVTQAWGISEPSKGFLPPLRITPDGFRALGDLAERYNWEPDYSPKEGKP